MEDYYLGPPDRIWHRPDPRGNVEKWFLQSRALNSVDLTQIIKPTRSTPFLWSHNREHKRLFPTQSLVFQNEIFGYIRCDFWRMSSNRKLDSRR
jgi:hypothetical protein